MDGSSQTASGPKQPQGFEVCNPCNKSPNATITAINKVLKIDALTIFNSSISELLRLRLTSTVRELEICGGPAEVSLSHSADKRPKVDGVKFGVEKLAWCAFLFTFKAQHKVSHGLQYRPNAAVLAILDSLVH